MVDEETNPPERAGGFSLEAAVASAIQLIVRAYIQVGDRAALVGLLDHRKRIAKDLRSRTGFDFRVPLDAVETETEVIEAGLAKYDGPPP
ncbi:hypothetical protein CIW50_24890 [Tardiphaga sp. P9-11]|nr:hypothetical protein CIW50_24890 [Tardiphaga sp. P9-11]